MWGKLLLFLNNPREAKNVCHLVGLEDQTFFRSAVHAGQPHDMLGDSVNQVWTLWGTEEPPLPGNISHNTLVNSLV